jgi:hypothetical protein
LAHDLLRAPKLDPASLPASLLPTLRLLGELGQAYTTLRGEGMAGEVAELAMTGAARNTDGYQIAEVLEGRTLEAARARGFLRALTICTHWVTAQLAEHAGYRRLAARSYDTYVVNGERVFSSIAKEHGEAVLCEKELAFPRGRFRYFSSKEEGLPPPDPPPGCVATVDDGEKAPDSPRPTATSPATARQ